MKETRGALKDHFQRGATPTQEHFENLIDSLINQEDDGVSKSPDDPLSIKAFGTDEGLINFYPVTGGTTPTWQLKQMPGGKAGLSIHDAAAEATPSRLFIESGTGNVGIGTMTPGGRLNVVGSAGAGQGVQIDNREIKIRGDGDTHYSIFGNRLSGKLTIENTGNNSAMNTAGTVLLAIEKGGNVGIGTTEPIYKLDVNGKIHVSNGVIQRGGDPITNTNDLGLYSQVENNNLRLVTNNGPIQFYADSGRGTTLNFEVRASGDVVARGTVFGQKLSVAGMIESTSGGFKFPDGTEQTTAATGGLWTQSGTAIYSNAGNVGIGTTAPAAKLEVKGGVTILEQEAWIEVQDKEFQNNWVNWGGTGWGTAGYFKDSLGIVHLKGIVRGGGQFTTVFTLPQGYRPAAHESHTAYSEYGQLTGIVLYSNGQVHVYTYTGSRVSLDGITFRAK